MIAGHALSSWALFAGVIVALLAVDLGVINRRPGVPTFRASLWWSIAMVALAAAFGCWVLLREGRADAVQFATGYLIELTLSVDNLLVFILVLRFFCVPDALQPTVLQWGILGAILMRAIVIGTGTLVLHEVSWVIYILGLMLVVTGVRMLIRTDSEPANPARNPVIRALRRVLPVTDDFVGESLFVRRDGRLMATPLLLVIIVIEWTDLIFAGDSIPAIFGISRDAYIVYTSNVFAVIGLRALFFVLAGMLLRFAYLRSAVAILLTLVGVKMLAARWVVIPPLWSLVGIVSVLTVALLASLWRERASG